MSKENASQAAGQQSDTLQCSFCGAGQLQVRKLVGGDGVYICDACVQTCSDLMREEAADAGEQATPSQAKAASWKRVFPPAATT